MEEQSRTRRVKKLLSIITYIFLAMFATACTTQSQLTGMPNPWQDDITLEQAAKVAGFQLPLELKDAKIRAMKDMIEINFFLDGQKDVCLRKSQTETNGYDISGDYNKYPKNEVLTLDNGVNINTRGDGNKINVMYFAAESGVYSARSEYGLSKKDVEKIYNMLAKVEACKIP